MRPVGRGWQIIIVEDADRLTEQACNALLKAVEEPTDRTVWMLCTPTIEDVLPTIRSRCRLVTLTTPTPEDVAAFLVRVDSVEPARGVRRQGEPRPHRARPGACPRRSHQEPAPGDRRLPGQLTSLARLHDSRRQPG